MSDEDRLARLTELARKAWPHNDIAIDSCGDFVRVTDPKDVTDPTLAQLDHPHALDALEAALCMLAYDPPQWAVEFAESLSNDEMPLSGHRVARELLAAAKRGTP
jgi:hypothetical protein